MKPSNHSILQVTRPDGQIEDWYLISDYGSTFGRMGPTAWFPSRNRWSLKDYQEEPFIESADDEYLHLHHKGDLRIRKVPLSHARWFAKLSSQLSIDQVRRAFEAAGASPEEVTGFSARLMEKLTELQSAVSE